MSLSRESVENDQQLLRYLLGLLPEEEIEQVEEVTIVDDEVAARLSSVENDLVDAYVTGTLDPETRERFEEFYLASPRRREKVTFAKRFLAAVDRAPVRVSAKVTQMPSPPKVEAAQSFSKRVMAKLDRLVRQAAALLLIVCGLLVFEYLRVRHGLDQAERDRVAQNRQAEMLTAQLVEARTANADTAKALERARASLTERERQPATGTAAGPDASGPLLAIVLSPQTRSIGSLPTIALAPGADRIAFDLRLESNDFPRYRAAVNDPGSDRMVWRSGVINARVRRGSAVVPIVVPASALQSQHYAIELEGLDTHGAAEIVGDYVFQLDRR